MEEEGWQEQTASRYDDYEWPDALREVDIHFINDLLTSTEDSNFFIAQNPGIHHLYQPALATLNGDPLSALPCPSCGSAPPFTCPCFNQDDKWIDHVLSVVDSTSTPSTVTSSSSCSSSSSCPAHLELPLTENIALEDCISGALEHINGAILDDVADALVEPDLESFSAPYNIGVSTAALSLEETLNMALRNSPGNNEIRQLLYGRYQEQRRSAAADGETTHAAAKRLSETLPIYPKAKKSAKKELEEEGKNGGGFEGGLNLGAILVECAQAVGAGEFQKAEGFLQDLRQRASPMGTPIQRMAHYFIKAIMARLSGNGLGLYKALSSKCIPTLKLLRAFENFICACPVMKTAYYFANQNILDAIGDTSRLHVVDYGILYGVQWHCLISCLAERKGGPPLLRITGIDFPQQGPPKNLPSDRLYETGQRLAGYAQIFKVPFEYKAIAQNWEDIEHRDLDIREDETLVINCMVRSHHLMDEPDVVPSPRTTVIKRIKKMNPKIFTVGVINASFNPPIFVSRVREAVYFYSAMFDIYEALFTKDEEDEELRSLLERDQLGRDILNVVACEGLDRVVRPELYRQWHSRFKRAGLHPLPLDKRILSRAQHLAKSNCHKEFFVEDGGWWLLLGWKGRIMQALSAWYP